MRKNGERGPRRSHSSDGGESVSERLTAPVPGRHQGTGNDEKRGGVAVDVALGVKEETMESKV